MSSLDPRSARTARNPDTDSASGDDASAGATTAAATDAGTAGRGADVHRRLVALLLLIAALGGLGLATLGAGAERGPGPTFVGQTGREFDPPEQQQQDYEPPEWPTENMPAQPPESTGTNTGLTATLIVIGVLLAVVALWVLYRMRKLARPAPGIAAAADEDELTPAQARAALDDARSHLSTVVDAHDAVIAAWLALERAIGETGVRRQPSQTTLEFVVAVLGALDLDRASLDRLAHLYRRALFDAEPLGEGDRDEAITLLDRLTDHLGAPPAGGPE